MYRNFLWTMVLRVNSAFILFYFIFLTGVILTTKIVLYEGTCLEFLIFGLKDFWVRECLNLA